MQSKEQKIIKLINSEDEENQNLGNLLMLSAINKDNALYWYLTIDQYRKKITNDVIELLTNTLGFDCSQYSLEQINVITRHIKTSTPDAPTINLFFKLYNEYVYSMISAQWPIEKQFNIKGQILVLNNGK